MYFDVTFGIFLSLKRLFVPRTVPKNFWVRNSTLTVTVLLLHSSLSKLKVSFFFCRNQGGGFPHEQALTVENPRPRQMTLDYFYGQSGELFSYFRIPKAHLLTYLIGFAPGSMVRAWHPCILSRRWVHWWCQRQKLHIQVDAKIQQSQQTVVFLADSTGDRLNFLLERI